MKYFGNTSTIRIFVKIFTDTKGNLKKIYDTQYLEKSYTWVINF